MTHPDAGTTEQRSTDVMAVVALVLAVVAPPLGVVLALFGARNGQRLTGLRVAAVVVGVILTVMTVLVGIMVFAGREAADT